MGKKNYIYWEWELATLDKDGDRVDLDHCEQDDVAKFIPFDDCHELNLVRRVGNDCDGETDRSYAEVIGSALDDETDDGTPVPKRFHKLLWNARHNVK